MHKIKKGETGFSLPNYWTTLTGQAAQTVPTLPKMPDISSENNKLQGIKNSLQTSTGAGSNLLQSMKTNLPSISGLASAGAGLVTNAITSLVPQAEDKGSQIGGQVLSGIGDIASMIPGIGTVVGAGLKGLSALVTSTGPTIKGNASRELTDTSSSYGGLQKYDTKKFGLFGLGAASKYKDKVNTREQQRIKSEDILKTSKSDLEAASGAAQNLSNAYNMALTGGWQQNNGIRFGKTGAKIEYDLSFASKVLDHLKEEIQVSKFEEGGKMNVIPDGALHARKHNIDDSSLNGTITSKGIPVVINKEGGEVEQVAEIERDEIIFTKEITDKLEELRDKGTPEAAIEAGRLLVQEILYNTQDNTGLINTTE